MSPERVVLGEGVPSLAGSWPVQAAWGKGRAWTPRPSTHMASNSSFLGLRPFQKLKGFGIRGRELCVFSSGGSMGVLDKRPFFSAL